MIKDILPPFENNVDFLFLYVIDELVNERLPYTIWPKKENDEHFPCFSYFSVNSASHILLLVHLLVK